MLTQKVHTLLSKLTLQLPEARLCLRIVVGAWAKALGVPKDDILLALGMLWRSGDIKVRNTRVRIAADGKLVVNGRKILKIRVVKHRLENIVVPDGLIDNALTAENTRLTNTHVPQSGSYVVQGGHRVTYSNISNISNPEPPNRLVGWDLVRRRESELTAVELSATVELVKKLYKKVFDYEWFGPRRRADWTAVKKLTALAECRGWDLHDYVEVNFQQFQKWNRRPMISNICGEKAETRYSEFLRAQGISAKSRNKEVVFCRRKHEQVLQSKAEGFLYLQVLDALDEKLAVLRVQLIQNLKTNTASLAAALSTVHSPVWLNESQSQKVDRYVDTRIAEKRLAAQQRYWNIVRERINTKY